MKRSLMLSLAASVVAVSIIIIIIAVHLKSHDVQENCVPVIHHDRFRPARSLQGLSI